MERKAEDAAGAGRPCCLGFDRHGNRCDCSVLSMGVLCFPEENLTLGVLIRY